MGDEAKEDLLRQTTMIKGCQRRFFYEKLAGPKMTAHTALHDYRLRKYHPLIKISVTPTSATSVPNIARQLIFSLKPQ